MSTLTSQIEAENENAGEVPIAAPLYVPPSPFGGE